MTKAEIVNEIARNTGIDRQTVLTTLEAFMNSVKTSLLDENGEPAFTVEGTSLDRFRAGCVTGLPDQHQVKQMLHIILPSDVQALFVSDKDEYLFPIG